MNWRTLFYETQQWIDLQRYDSQPSICKYTIRRAHISHKSTAYYNVLP